MISPFIFSASCSASSVLPTAVGPTIKTRGCFSNGIFEMDDRWLSGWLSLNGDHIDLPVIDLVFGWVIFCRCQHMFTLASRDVVFREKVFAGDQGFYFNEDRDI